MFSFKKKSLDYKDIKNPPCSVSYPMINLLFKNNKIGVNILSLTILDLIKNNQIKCEININESYNAASKLTQNNFEVMKNITLRIANKGELKTSQTSAVSLLKSMNKSKKFNLKAMAKNSSKTSIADKFEKDFIEFVSVFKAENDFDGNNYKDIMKNSKLTSKGKKLKKDWINFTDYLKSDKLSEKYPPESVFENSSQIIYGACFGIEKEVLRFRENNSSLSDFIDKDGYKLLNMIFNNALANVSKKRKGDGIFYGVNDKYTIPGGG